MTNYREMIGLGSSNYSQRPVGQTVVCSRQTVEKVLRKASAKGGSGLWKAMWPTRIRRRRCFRKSTRTHANIRNRTTAISNQELAQVWHWLYCGKNQPEVSRGRETPYMSTQFGDKYQRWTRKGKSHHAHPAQAWRRYSSGLDYALKSCAVRPRNAAIALTSLSCNVVPYALQQLRHLLQSYLANSSLCNTKNADPTRWRLHEP